MTLSALLDVTPILMLIVLGIVIRSVGLIDQQRGLVLTKLAYYVTIPATIFSSIARSQLTGSMLLLPVIGFGLPCLLAGVAFISSRRLSAQPQLRGVILVAMVVLGVFGYPFFLIFFGEEGLARMAMYDVGNSIYAGTVALVLARTFGARDPRNGQGLWRAMASSPILWAALLGVLASILGLTIMGPIGDFLGLLAGANTPLAMIAVGIFVRPRAAYGSLIAQFIGIRMVLGAILGLALSLLAGMAGLDVIVACAASVLPAGTTALVYAANEGLDAEFAASIISITVVIGAVAINVLPHLLAAFYL